METALAPSTPTIGTKRRYASFYIELTLSNWYIVLLPKVFGSRIRQVEVAELHQPKMDPLLLFMFCAMFAVFVGALIYGFALRIRGHASIRTVWIVAFAIIAIIFPLLWRKVC